MNRVQRKFMLRKKKAVRKVVKRAYLKLERLIQEPMEPWAKYCIANGIVALADMSIAAISQSRLPEPGENSYTVSPYMKNKVTP